MPKELDLEPIKEWSLKISHINDLSENINVTQLLEVNDKLTKEIERLREVEEDLRDRIDLMIYTCEH